MSQPENTKKPRKEMQGDKKRLKDEKKARQGPNQSRTRSNG